MFLIYQYNRINLVFVLNHLLHVLIVLVITASINCFVKKLSVENQLSRQASLKKIKRK